MGCAGRVLALLGLLGIVAVAWFRGAEIRERVQPGPGTTDAPVPSEALASDAVERYEALLRGESERLELTAGEVESVIVRDGGAFLPEGVGDVRVRFADGEARVDLRVAFDLLPELVELERVRNALPEAIPLTLRGPILTLDGGEAVLVVRRVDAVGVPIPRGLFPAALRSLAPADRPELPPEALLVPLPAGIGSAYIDGDRLVFVGSS